MKIKLVNRQKHVLSAYSKNFSAAMYISVNIDNEIVLSNEVFN